MHALRNCHFRKDVKLLPMQTAEQYGTLHRQWWMAVGKVARNNIRDFLPSTNDRKYFG